MSITDTELEVDLSLEAEDQEPCSGCTVWDEGYREATWHVYFTSACSCLPNPLPLCETHKGVVDKYMAIYGPDQWDCALCGSETSVDRVERIRRS